MFLLLRKSIHSDFSERLQIVEERAAELQCNVLKPEVSSRTFIQPTSAYYKDAAKVGSSWMQGRGCGFGWQWLKIWVAPVEDYYDWLRLRGAGLKFDGCGGRWQTQSVTEDACCWWWLTVLGGWLFLHFKCRLIIFFLIQIIFLYFPLNVSNYISLSNILISLSYFPIKEFYIWHR